MRNSTNDNRLDHLITHLSRLWQTEDDRKQVARLMPELDVRYGLNLKIVAEPGVERIIEQMFGRLANSYKSLSGIHGKRILDIACGSSTSKLPASFYVDTPFGDTTFGRAKQGYTAQFEPWFCRILFALGADAVGIDFGDNERELFTHYQVDLGQIGALNFLPEHSFDALQDSRLFGSPEFTSQFPNPADHLKIAQEIKRQERRLLKMDGIIIHSDAQSLLR